MVALIGKTCVGKTFLLEKAREMGYSTLNCDDFFKEQYKFGNKCYKLIESNFGESYVNQINVDKNRVKKLISNKKSRDAIEKIIFPVLFEHLQNFKYDFVEIPILYSENGKFEHFFRKTLNVIASMDTRKKILKFKNVDNYDFEFFDSLNTGFSKIGDVDIDMDNIPIDIDWKLFFKSHYI